MGFFNPFYYLKYLLRKLPKKILVFICIFLIICLCHLKGYCVDDVNSVNVPNTDIYNQLELQYKQDFYRLFYTQLKYAKNNNNTFHSTFKYFAQCVTVNSSRFFWFVADEYSSTFFKNRNGEPILNDNNNVVFYGVISEESSSYDYDDYFVLPGARNSSYSSNKSWALASPSSSSISYRINYIQDSGNVVTVTNNLQGYFYMPVGLEHYCPTDLYDILYNIANDNYSFSNTDDVLADISQKIDETNQQLEDMNDFFNSDTTPTITNSDLPSDTMTDVTSSGFDGIFTKIYNAFTSQGFETINITIPYLNYTFSVSSDFTRLAIRHFTSNIGTYSFENFFYLLWYFAFSRYIVLDIYKYINDIKNGNISKTDTNIKADML